MQTVFQLCLTVIPMMFSLSMFNVITDSVLTKSVPSSDTGKAVPLGSEWESRQTDADVSTFNPPVSVSVHRHDAGPLFFCAVAPADSRTDCWGLPLRKLRRFLHRGRSVCGERHRFHVPAAASSQKHGQAGVTPLGRSPSSPGDGGRVNRCAAAGPAPSGPYRPERLTGAPPS